MASGYGITGGVSRCYPFWQDFLACYVINTSESKEDGRWRCLPQKNDYYECLHHHKEIEKTKTIRAAYLRRTGEGSERFPEGGGPDSAKSLGVLEK